MSWKDLKISVKLGIGFGSLIISIILIVIISISKLIYLEKITHDLIVKEEQASFVVEKIVDHYEWTENVNILFFDNNIKTVNVEVDFKKCSLGKWLYSDEIKHMSSKNPTFKILLNKIIEQHIRLHESVKKINKNYETSKSKAIQIYQNETINSRDNVQTLLKQVEKFFIDDAHTVEKELKHQIKTTKQSIVIFSIFAIFIGIFFAFIFIKGITKKLNETVQFAKIIADGDLTNTLNIKQKDEIGILATALNEMSTKLQKMFKNISLGIQTLSSSSIQLSNSSEQISSNSTLTADRSNNVAAASEEMSTNMSNVATSIEQASENIQSIVAAVEEMSSTIYNISQNASNGSNTTNIAVDSAKNVFKQINNLGTSVIQISEITDTIKDISEQTNLLALNATIEAARAGDAGKGFAVVAAEIKDLAIQTADATTEISEKIDNVQSSSKKSIELIKNIVEVINQIDNIVTSVSNAVEEQSLATKEISNNVSEAGIGINDVTENVNQISSVTDEVAKDIAYISQSAQETNNDSNQISKTSTELSNLAQNLNSKIKQFKL